MDFQRADESQAVQLNLAGGEHYQGEQMTYAQARAIAEQYGAVPQRISGNAIDPNSNPETVVGTWGIPTQSGFVPITGAMTPAESWRGAPSQDVQTRQQTQAPAMIDPWRGPVFSQQPGDWQAQQQQRQQQSTLQASVPSQVATATILPQTPEQTAAWGQRPDNRNTPTYQPQTASATPNITINVGGTPEWRRNAPVPEQYRGEIDSTLDFMREGFPSMQPAGVPREIYDTGNTSFGYPHSYDQGLARQQRMFLPSMYDQRPPAPLVRQPLEPWRPGGMPSAQDIGMPAPMMQPTMRGTVNNPYGGSNIGDYPQQPAYRGSSMYPNLSR